MPQERGPQAKEQRATRARHWSSYSFKGRVVLITGGSRGLGLVLARQLVGLGAKVAILARNAAELDCAADELRTRGGQVLTLPGDIGKREVAHNAVEQTVAHFGRLDIVINNAGIIQMGPFEHMNSDDFRQTMAVHFWGPLHTIRAAIPHLQKQEGARIVNISSFGGKLALPHLIPYCASKFALQGLSSGLRGVLAAHGIPVTTVCPGLLRTGSHLHALFKGQQQKEYFWFALAASLPIVSMSALRAARRILLACKRGESEIVLGLPYRIAARLSPLFPRLTALSLKLLERLLPGPTGHAGNTALQGSASRMLTPEVLTYLADRAAQANNELPASS